MSETLPPQNLEAEERVLGAIMLAPNAIESCAEIVRPADFFRVSHGRIYEAALALYLNGDPVDALAVVEELEKANRLDDAGGRVRVNELAALAPAAGNVAHYAQIVADAALRRGMTAAAAEIHRLAFHRDGHDARALLDMAEAALFAIAETRQTSDFVKADVIIREAYERLSALFESGADVVGVPTGLRRLDEFTSGLQPGNLVVIAARPSMGKSGMVLGILAHIAIRIQRPAALFTLEMSRYEIAQRLLAAEGLVDSASLRNGRVRGEDWPRILAASESVAGAPLYIEDSATVTATDIRSRARRLKAREPGLACIAVDYLQLMTSGRTQENRVQEVAAISRSLKALARELDIPVLALSQLSRAPEQRHDKRPILSDLRESGSIEQDADLVWFLYRDEYYHPEDTDQHGIAELNIAKQRNGPTGTIKLSFVKRYARFGDLHETWDQTHRGEA